MATGDTAMSSKPSKKSISDVLAALDALRASALELAGDQAPPATRKRRKKRKLPKAAQDAVDLRELLTDTEMHRLALRRKLGAPIELLAKELGATAQATGILLGENKIKCKARGRCVTLRQRLTRIELAAYARDRIVLDNVPVSEVAKQLRMTPTGVTFMIEASGVLSVSLGGAPKKWDDLSADAKAYDSMRHGRKHKPIGENGGAKDAVA
jgi:hypothetical protein